MNKKEIERFAVMEEQLRQNNIQHKELNVKIEKGFSDIKKKFDEVIEAKADKDVVDLKFETLNKKVRVLSNWKDKLLLGIIGLLVAIILLLLKNGGI